jgi:hypothetical protein
MRALNLRVRAWLALGSFLMGFALPFLAARHLTFDDDAACGNDELVVVRLHTQFETPKPVQPPGHCPLCHWLRAVSGAHPDHAPLVATWLEPVAVCPAPVYRAQDVASVTHRPSRAPPTPIA